MSMRLATRMPEKPGARRASGHLPACLALALALALASPASANPPELARMWTYANGQPREVPFSVLSMTVFSAAGVRRVTVDAATEDIAEDGPSRQGDPYAGHGTWTASLGYRRETLDFNIAGLDGHPNVVSALDWDTDMLEVRMAGDWLADSGFFATVDLAHARGFSGEMRDSDYGEDNRRDEFSRSYAKSRGSLVSRLSFGLGWRFAPRSGASLTPLLGYAWQRHNLRASQGRQHIDTRSGYAGPFPGLDTHFKPRWHGPWMGLRLDARVTERLAFRLLAKRQWFDYRAFANWNLRDDFSHPVSFRQEGDSRGWQLEIGASWRISPASALTFSLDQYWQRLKNGKQRFFAADGQATDVGLNRARWESWSAALGYRMDF
ncbi:MAG: hypothetical protein LBO79_04450 [Zoogloeaceae bacterium]|jgi:hypothetical protein|nr:hypothetical protein [Zoogloeaceae bacterium]